MRRRSFARLLLSRRQANATLSQRRRQLRARARQEGSRSVARRSQRRAARGRPDRGRGGISRRRPEPGVRHSPTARASAPCPAASALSRPSPGRTRSTCTTFSRFSRRLPCSKSAAAKKNQTKDKNKHKITPEQVTPTNLHVPETHEIDCFAPEGCAWTDRARALLWGGGGGSPRLRDKDARARTRGTAPS